MNLKNLDKEFEKDLKIETLII